ncbi:XRE family transcriptional regulator [Aquibaculum sediminis]|uniref:XRE family transcriptional regulator n=1 Tax=Aquibaculum sediminis TaxID=3231907 RepID=UPI003454928B
MDTLAQTLRRWRRSAGLSQPQLAARLGVSQQAVQQLEAGSIRNPRYLLRLAEVMGADPKALAEGRYQPAATEAAEPLAGGALLNARDLPVFASAQAGPDGMVVTFDPIEWIQRPAPLATVRDAFAMYVVNDSMEPRYRQGDLLLIHPQRPVRPGRDVLVIVAAEDGEHRAWVKELVSLDAGRLRLRQLNPAQEFEIARSQVNDLHLVVGVYYNG